MTKENLIVNIYKVGFVLLIVLTILAGLYAINVYREGKLIGTSTDNTITVNGAGKVQAVPNISNITFTIRESGKDVKEAQDIVSKKIDNVLKDVKTLIEEKDIKTDNYSSYPKYSYPTNEAAKIEGYETTQSVTLKIRNTENVSKILNMISSAKINEVSGPSFTIDDDKVYKDEARSKAISDAKSQAEKLAKELGVDLGRIISFSENTNNNYPTPYLMTAKVMDTNLVSAESVPNIPAGENEISSNVTITFEIK